MKRKARILALITAMFMLSSMACFAHAVPDLTKNGSVTVNIKYTDSNKPVKKGILEVFKVGDVLVDDGNYSFGYSEEFESCSVPLDVSKAETADKIAEFATRNDMTGKMQKNKTGTVVFKDMKPGLYLIGMRAKGGKSYINPFLISIPAYQNGTYIYDVDASPKAGTLDEKIRLDGEDDEDTIDNEPDEDKDGRDGNSKGDDSGTIPQTGQLWWPVPILAAIGLIFMLLGWRRGRDA